MGTTIDYPVQSLDAWRNKTLANTKAPKTLEKSSEQPGPPDKATKAGEFQVRDLDMANDPRDMVEIQNLNHQVIEANQASLENRVKDVDEASKLAQEIIGLLNSENERSRVEQVHDLSQVNLLDLLSQFCTEQMSCRI